jgi:tetratricopeptide (TPR) repeat protein
MIANVPSLLVLALASMAPATPPVAAQTAPPTDARNWAVCRHEIPQTPLAAEAAACTALLDSGRLTSRQRAEALSNRAIVYRSQRDYPRAIADYEAGLAIDPQFDWAHAGLGASYRDSGNPGRAIPHYDISMRLGEAEIAGLPEGPTREDRINRIAFGYYGRGRAYDLLGDHRRAVADFREAVRRAPREPDMANALCWNLAIIGENLDEARAACDAALRERPDHAPALDSRAMVALKQGRFQDAWNDYDAATRINPEGASWVYGRGIAALRLGRTAEGRADIARAEALNAEVTRYYADLGIRP